MIPFPVEEILPMLAMLFLRLGLPVLLILMMGTLVQRFEQRLA